MSGKRTKHLKPTYLKRIPGDHRIRFYIDLKSKHPFMCISIYCKTYYGHEMTSHPSLYKDGSVKVRFIRFKVNPNPKDKRKSFYKKSITRISGPFIGKINRLAKKKNWRISKKDLGNFLNGTFKLTFSFLATCTAICQSTG